MPFSQRKTHVKCLLSFCLLLAFGEFYSAEVKYLVKCFYLLEKDINTLYMEKEDILIW